VKSPLSPSVLWSLTLAFLALGLLQLPAEEKDKKVDFGISSVWSVDSPAGHRIYLIGSIHLLRDQDYPLPSVFEKAYRDSARVVFELPPGSEGNGEVVTRMREMGSYGPGDMLSKHVSADTLKRTVAWCNAHQIPENVVQQLRPWFLALTISAVEYQQMGAKADQGLDTYFENRAQKDGKPGDGLESVEYQLSLFSRLSDKLQEELLLQTLSEIESLKKDYEEMVTAWRSGNSAKLQEYLFKDSDKFPELMQEFLFKRNKAWIAPLEEYLNKGVKAFVVVGAGHLGGKKGVIELLKERGFTVTQLKD